MRNCERLFILSLINGQGIILKIDVSGVEFSIVVTTVSGPFVISSKQYVDTSSCSVSPLVRLLSCFVYAYKNGAYL